jgi:hypothetical protein
MILRSEILMPTVGLHQFSSFDLVLPPGFRHMPPTPGGWWGGRGSERKGKDGWEVVYGGGRGVRAEGFEGGRDPSRAKASWDDRAGIQLWPGGLLNLTTGVVTCTRGCEGGRGLTGERGRGGLEVGEGPASDSLAYRGPPPVQF